MPLKVAGECLNSCSGCEISIADFGERLLSLLDLVDFVHFPILMDHKYYGQQGDGKVVSIPEAQIGIISGGLRNEEHVTLAEEMRRKCDLIVGLGTCATHGGIPSMANSCTVQDTLDCYYSTETTDKAGFMPSDGLPRLLDRCKALDELIKVDVYLPGCPPHPDQIFAALMALLSGNRPVALEKSVCSDCSAIRQGKGAVKELRRFLDAPDYDPAEPISRMRCLLEQGFLCMGPVTLGGCGGDTLLPRCISARVPCRGCSGPVKQDGNQLIDLLNALVSNGIDIKSLPEHGSLLRFSGAHNLLRPKRKLGSRDSCPK